MPTDGQTEWITGLTFIHEETHLGESHTTTHKIYSGRNPFWVTPAKAGINWMKPIKIFVLDKSIVQNVRAETRYQIRELSIMKT